MSKDFRLKVEELTNQSNLEICKKKGLTGLQGVMIPKRNIKNLVLKNKVIEAVKEGKFHIYGIENIEEGIEILTGLQVGVMNDLGEYPQDTLNYRIMKNLETMQVASAID